MTFPLCVLSLNDFSCLNVLALLLTNRITTMMRMVETRAKTAARLREVPKMGKVPYVQFMLASDSVQNIIIIVKDIINCNALFCLLSS